MVDKISGQGHFPPLGQVNRTDKPAAGKRTDNPKPTDRIDFSNALQNATKAQAADSTPDAARLEKLADLKNQIQNGTYQPDLNRVAASLLPSLLRED